MYDTFCRETLKYGTFCRKNLYNALRAKKWQICVASQLHILCYSGEEKEKLISKILKIERRKRIFFLVLKIERRKRNFSSDSWKSRVERDIKISFSRAREKNLSHFSSRISRDRDSCQCLGSTSSFVKSGLASYLILQGRSWGWSAKTCCTHLGFTRWLRFGQTQMFTTGLRKDLKDFLHCCSAVTSIGCLLFVVWIL